jgi:hypothetical protein
MAAAKKKAKSKPKKKAPAKKPAPSRKAAPPRKKAVVKKPLAKKPAAKKSAKKPAAKKPVAKKATAKAPAATQKRPVAILSAVPVAPRVIPAAKPAAVPERGPLPNEEPIGIVTHYYNHLSVAVVQLDTGYIQVGDTIRFLGHTTDFRQRVDSLQIEHEAVTEVGRRQAFGLKVKQPVREHDVVYKVGAP